MGPVNLDKFLVTGAGGMVGQNVHFGLKFDHRELDVTNKDMVELVCNRIGPSGILNLAALDIRQCEADPLKAYHANVMGTYNLALQARNHDIPMVLVSSAAVFDGKQTEYFYEDRPPDPVNIYGQTKQLAELMLTEMLPDSLIVRTGWLYGGHGAHHPKFVDVAIDKARRGEQIDASTDQDGSPTYVSDFLEELERQLTAGSGRVVHIINSGRATALDVAEMIVSQLSSQSTINPMKIVDMSDAGPARSRSEALTSHYVELRSWQEALSEYIRKLDA